MGFDTLFIALLLVTIGALVNFYTSNYIKARGRGINPIRTNLLVGNKTFYRFGTIWKNETILDQGKIWKNER